MNTTDTSPAGAPQFSITLTLTPQGERTQLDFQLLGYAGKPGDGFVYDGWDEGLTNLSRHLVGKKVG